MLVAPLLLVQSTSAPPRPHAAAPVPKDRTHPPARAVGVKLHSHLVAYQAPTTTTTTAPPATTTTTAPPTTTTTLAPRVVTPTTAPPAPPTTTTTTTAPPPANQEVGEATWYSAASAGMCASPTLPFGTVLTVVNDATGASTQCTVDDREGAGYPRVVDMSPAGFSQIADLSQGVVEVTISW
ncbi:MAG TPA: septal ring lytic transglycosylase RlpA family protein [Acidimicrobiales bacterium]|nr:septal ring lytic transglycosylase RlpA family protein [Acidimicrobiales bacterium]